MYGQIRMERRRPILMMNQKALLAALVCYLLTGCSSGLTTHAKNIGIKDEKDIDGGLQNYEDAIDIFIRHGVLNSSSLLKKPMFG